jgi:hypothetical protein
MDVDAVGSVHRDTPMPERQEHEGTGHKLLIAVKVLNYTETLNQVTHGVGR